MHVSTYVHFHICVSLVYHIIYCEHTVLVHVFHFVIHEYVIRWRHAKYQQYISLFQHSYFYRLSSIIISTSCNDHRHHHIINVKLYEHIITYTMCIIQSLYTTVHLHMYIMNIYVYTLRRMLNYSCISINAALYANTYTSPRHVPSYISLDMNYNATLNKHVDYICKCICIICNWIAHYTLYDEEFSCYIMIVIYDEEYVSLYEIWYVDDIVWFSIHYVFDLRYYILYNLLRLHHTHTLSYLCFHNKHHNVVTYCVIHMLTFVVNTQYCYYCVFMLFHEWLIIHCWSSECHIFKCYLSLFFIYFFNFHDVS